MHSSIVSAPPVVPVKPIVNREKSSHNSVVPVAAAPTASTGLQDAPTVKKVREQPPKVPVRGENVGCLGDLYDETIERRYFQLQSLRHRGYNALTWNPVPKPFKEFQNEGKLHPESSTECGREVFQFARNSGFGLHNRSLFVHRKKLSRLAGSDSIEAHFYYYRKKGDELISLTTRGEGYLYGHGPTASSVKVTIDRYDAKIMGFKMNQKFMPEMLLLIINWLTEVYNRGLKNSKKVSTLKWEKLTDSMKWTNRYFKMLSEKTPPVFKYHGYVSEYHLYLYNYDD